MAETKSLQNFLLVEKVKSNNTIDKMSEIHSPKNHTTDFTKHCNASNICLYYSFIQGFMYDHIHLFLFALST